MRLTFRVRFHTELGQCLFLTGNHESLGDGEFQAAIPLQYLDNESWQVTLVFPRGTAPDAEISYNYLLREPEGSLIQDWGSDRVVNPAAFAQEAVLLIDAWNNPAFYENTFYTEPFKRVLLQPDFSEVRTPAPERVTHTFKVKAPLLTKGQTLCLLGNSASLGNWNTATPLLLNRLPGQDFLSAQLDLSRESFPLLYKYGVFDVERKALVRYEAGANRVLHDTIAPSKVTIVNDGFAVLPSATWKGAGVAIPVFSLRSERSFGVGEFADLAGLVDWCGRTGLKLIQVLPINDTTATHTSADSYPYSAISAFALHPMYLNLERLAKGPNRRLLASLEPERKRLNALEEVDYAAVMQAKLAFIKQVYPSQKQQTFKSNDYKAFYTQNQHWLRPYAAFCCLRDQYGTADFNQWPAMRTCQEPELAALAAPGSEAHVELGLHYFIQYHLHVQLREAAEYAHAHGVILKGDLAIGVYRYGADAWQRPELYRLDMQAGAPPDAFAAKGQNWSFPTYNWPRMQEDGFAWWKQRFGQMGCYFDAFRIDHILGFFRIWSIPTHAVEGILGYFVRALPVRAEEFASRGIPFDRNRYLKPFITDRVLSELFGNDSEAVRREFLESDRFGNHTLKPEFSTQREVERHFAALEDTEANRKLKQGLFDLLSNVLLFEVAGSQGQEFHFRYGMESTASFQQLDPVTQRQLKELYVDYFFRRQDAFWMKEGMQKLPALKRVTNMLVCGEDLGMVPPCVPVAMKQIGLLSLEVQRMPKDQQHEFSRPAEAPYLSVVTPSTHDMSTIRGWWEEDPGVSQKFYHQELSLPGEAPPACEPWLNRLIVQQHLASPAMWSIFQLQDLLGMDAGLRRPNPHDERINIPADPRHYWRYRMHLPLERLLAVEGFNEELKGMLQQNGR